MDNIIPLQIQNFYHLQGEKLLVKTEFSSFIQAKRFEVELVQNITYVLILLLCFLASLKNPT